MVNSVVRARADIIIMYRLVCLIPLMKKKKASSQPPGLEAAAHLIEGQAPATLMMSTGGLREPLSRRADMSGRVGWGPW